MFADKTMQKCQASFSGVGAFQFDPNGDGAFDLWAAHFANGEAEFYYAESDDGTIWECGYGALNTSGSPVTMSRTLLSSVTGSLINWQTTDGPVHVYSGPSAVAMKHTLSPLINGVANVPGWLPIGAVWVDYSLGYTVGSPTAATAWITKRYIGGTRTNASSHVEIGRAYLADAFFSASQRLKSKDIGAANYVLTADDVGKLLEFDCTVAVRTLTMLAHDAAGMGEGAHIYVRPYGGSANGVTFTPGGADVTALGSAPAGRVTRFNWSASKATWVADAVVGSSYRTVADAATTVTAADSLVIYTSLSASRNVTLPAASTFPVGVPLEIIDGSGSASQSVALSLVPNGTDTIAGSNAAQVAINEARGRCRLWSNGVNGWHVDMWSVLYVAALGSDQALNNTGTFFDGPSAAQGTVGTWDAVASISLSASSTGGSGDPMLGKLWDGTTVADSIATNIWNGGGATAAALVGTFVNPAGNIKVSFKDTGSTSGKMVFNATGSSKDCTLKVRRVA